MKDMEKKYIVKLEWTEESPMILVKDAKSYGNKSVPYALKRMIINIL